MFYRQKKAVEVTGTVSSKLSAVANADETGRLRVAVYGTTDLKENDVLLNLRFTAIGAPGTMSPLALDRIMLNEGDPMTTAAAGQVTLSAAAPNQAEITGRVLSAFGEGIPNARVTLTDISSKTRAQTAVSNGFGFYRLGGLSIGHTYTINVQSRERGFDPITVSVTDQSLNVDMIAR
jgi:Carboxypeptidase regulatory-like domain